MITFLAAILASLRHLHQDAPQRLAAAQREAVAMPQTSGILTQKLGCVSEVNSSAELSRRLESSRRLSAEITYFHPQPVHWN